MYALVITIGVPAIASAQTTLPGGQPGVPVCSVTPTAAVCFGGSFHTGPAIGSTFIPVSSLVSTSTFNEATQRLEAKTDALAAIQLKSGHVISGGVAMASAMDMISPADGRTNRIGGGVATFNDQAGFAMVYTRQSAGWDAGLGLATSRYENMAKATVGFSW
jgi:hypothetical protein